MNELSYSGKFRSSNHLDSITLDDFPEGVPLYNSIFYDSIQNAVNSGKLRESMSYHYLLKIGKYNEVKAATELELDWGLNNLDSNQLAKMLDYKLTDAHEHIINESKNHTLIIISEAHTKPEHRVFTRCLLSDLYDEGYRHLGLENILPFPKDPNGRMMDSLMNERGYPLVTAFSGIYTSEPEYSNLIREASALGFTIFSYERNGSSESERDRQQAERIINYMSKIPSDEKVICHGGWYHAIEGPIEKEEGSNNYWLAYEYKALSNDDPLTIYQDALNFKNSENQQSSPYYKSIMGEIEENSKPMVLVNNENQSWKGPFDSFPFDIVTIEPKFNYSYNDNDLPWNDWNCFSCNVKRLNVDLFELNSNINTGENFIVELRRHYESKLATPIYSKQVSKDNPELDMKVCAGTYSVVYIKKNNERYEIVIDL